MKYYIINYFFQAPVSPAVVEKAVRSAICDARTNFTISPKGGFGPITPIPSGDNQVNYYSARFALHGFNCLLNWLFNYTQGLILKRILNILHHIVLHEVKLYDA